MTPPDTNKQLDALDIIIKHAKTIVRHEDGGLDAWLTTAEHDKAAIQAYVTEQKRLARMQTALNFATRLKHEFVKRNLSSDKMPDGYRKMTDEELVAKVWSELATLKGEQ